MGHPVYIYICMYIYIATLAKRWKVQFRLGFATTTTNSTILDSNNGIQISRNYYAKEIESTVDIHRYNIYIYMHS